MGYVEIYMKRLILQMAPTITGPTICCLQGGDADMAEAQVSLVERPENQRASGIRADL